MPMVSQKARRGGNPTALQDAERMACLILQEASTSAFDAARIIGKLIVVATLGFVLASNCCLSAYFVPIGIYFLTVSAAWLDAIGKECSCHRFFPQKKLNEAGRILLRWQWVVFWACVLFVISSTGAVETLRFALRERVWNVCVMAVVPLSLMLLHRVVEPHYFGHVRADVQNAEMIVRQLVATDKPSDISALAPLFESEQVPLYKLGSVAKLLYNIASGCDPTRKVAIELTQLRRPELLENVVMRTLSKVFMPFRSVASDLFLWGRRDIALHAIIVMYLALVYLGWFYFPLTPLAALVPFLGPKSRAGRYVRALQENIRIVQGKSAEKGRNAEPNTAFHDYLPKVNWPMLFYLSSTHILALYAIVVVVFFNRTCPLAGQGQAVESKTFVFAAWLYVFSALGITAGSHRLWAHRSYKASLPLRVFLMILNSIANQGSIYHWCRDHRVHHLYSDTIADPHDSNRGFWFSHVGWLVLKKHPAVKEMGKKVNMLDLQSDPVVVFQNRADPFWNLMWCFAFPSFAALLWGDSFWNGFLVAGVLRYVATLNATWAVNSVVHAWGNKPYDPSHKTTDNGWVSLFSIGEGWHNWHHAFAWDYAAAELGPLLQFNPTKVFIDLMVLLGLAWDRKRATDVWNQRKARWEANQGRPVLESLEGPPLFKHRVVTFGPAPYDEESDHDADDEATCASRAMPTHED